MKFSDRKKILLSRKVKYIYHSKDQNKNADETCESRQKLHKSSVLRSVNLKSISRNLNI